MNEVMEGAKALFFGNSIIVKAKVLRIGSIAKEVVSLKDEYNRSTVSHNRISVIMLALIMVVSFFPIKSLRKFSIRSPPSFARDIIVQILDENEIAYLAFNGFENGCQLIVFD